MLEQEEIAKAAIMASEKVSDFILVRFDFKVGLTTYTIINIIRFAGNYLSHKCKQDNLNDLNIN